MTPRQLEDLMTWIIIGVILGGRLGYVAVLSARYYLANPGEILMVWQGGMAFHGGLLGVVVAGSSTRKRHGIPKLSATDAICLGVPPGLLLGASRISSMPSSGAGRPTCPGA
jgi:phosphatidylglycerol---prolipoprotein diacylglyceryl transferase